jgi:hypothetical protein
MPLSHWPNTSDESRAHQPSNLAESLENVVVIHAVVKLARPLILAEQRSGKQNDIPEVERRKSKRITSGDCVVITKQILGAFGD